MTSITGQVLVLIGSDGKRATVSRAIATEASLVLRELLDGRVAVRSELNTTHENLSFPSMLESVTTSPTTSLTKVVATNAAETTSMMMTMKSATQINNKLGTEEQINNKELELRHDNTVYVSNNDSHNEVASIDENGKLNSTLPPNQVYKLPDLMDFSASNDLYTSHKANEYGTQVKQSNPPTLQQTALMNTSSSLSNVPESVDHTQLPSRSQITVDETNLLDYLMDNKSPINTKLTINANHVDSSTENNELLNNNLFDAIDSALDASSGNRKNNSTVNNNNNINVNNIINGSDLISEPNLPFGSSEPFAMAINNNNNNNNNNFGKDSVYHHKQFQEVVELPFPYFTGDILELVCQHMSYRFRVSSFGTENGMCQVYRVKMREIPKPMTLPLTEYLDLQDRRFISDWNETTTVLMVKAATLLNYNELLQLASAKLASYLCEKNVDGIRILLGAASDFSQAEEAELKKEQVTEVQK